MDGYVAHAQSLSHLAVRERAGGRARGTPRGRISAKTDVL